MNNKRSWQERDDTYTAYKQDYRTAGAAVMPGRVGNRADTAALRHTSLHIYQSQNFFFFLGQTLSFLSVPLLRVQKAPLNLFIF